MSSKHIIVTVLDRHWGFGGERWPCAASVHWAVRRASAFDAFRQIDSGLFDGDWVSLYLQGSARRSKRRNILWSARRTRRILWTKPSAVVPERREDRYKPEISVGDASLHSKIEGLVKESVSLSSQEAYNNADSHRHCQPILVQS